MKTKALVLSAAIGLLGAASSMAQVYSQNYVGFYNVSLVTGFNMIANQLNNGDNNVNTIIPSAPDGSSLLTWNAAAQAFNPADTYLEGFGWADADFNLSSTALVPGQGAFLQSAGPATITMVGEGPQGTLTLGLVENFQIVSQLTPQAIGLDATGFPAADGDSLLFWNSGTQAYNPGLTYLEGFGWADADFNQVDPTPSIGESFFYQRASGGGNATWTRNFSVNP